MQITNFSCFKNKKEKDNHPDYRLSANVDGEFVEIGAGWIKEATGGTKYISFKLTEPYEARNGYHIVVDPAPKQPVKPEPKETPVIEYPDEEIKSDYIPF
jgi:hypothetical protein